MKKSELKKILRPLIKECIKEVIFEEGVLSNIVSEVVHGIGGNMIVASKQPTPQPMQYSAVKQQKEQVLREEQAKQKIQETRKKMLDAIGRDSYNGVDIFEGTTAAPAASDATSALSGVDPSDPGVDVSQLFNGAGKNWSRLIK